MQTSNPRRWVEGDEEQIKKMNHRITFVLFAPALDLALGVGSISLIEIGKAVPVWFCLFDVSWVALVALFPVPSRQEKLADRLF